MPIANLTCIAHISATGPDTLDFLQGQLTCDLQALTPDKVMLGAYCNLKGRVSALLQIQQKDDTIWLSMPTALIESTHKTLAKYAAFSKLTLKEQPKSLVRYGVWGDDALTILQSLKLTTPEKQYATTEHEGTSVVRHPGIMPRFEIISEQALPTSTTKEEAWLAEGLKIGLAFLTSKSQGLFLPQELNLENWQAVSFNKGCYLGQEVIARLHYRGQLKTVLAYFKPESPIVAEAGEKFRYQNVQATLVAKALDAENQQHVLGLVAKDTPHLTLAKNLILQA